MDNPKNIPRTPPDNTYMERNQRIPFCYIHPIKHGNLRYIDVMEEKNIIEIKNKRAEYEYFLLDDYTAGLVLTGTEIKSIRDGRANLTDSYCVFIGNELYVRQMHISEYRFGSYLNHAAKRDRKLLLNRRELRKLQIKIKERGFTIIPVKLFINPQGRAKLLISLARGKKFYDKRESIKEKDTRRDMQRQLR